MELTIFIVVFLEGMKKISMGVCLNDYTWLEIWEKERWNIQKDQVKKMKKIMMKNGLEKNEKKMKKEKK